MTLSTAPGVALGEELSELDMVAVFGHYGLEVADPIEQATSIRQAALALRPWRRERAADRAGRPAAGPSSSSESPVEAVHSEEELQVGKRRWARPVRLKRFVVTDYITKTIRCSARRCGWRRSRSTSRPRVSRPSSLEWRGDIEGGGGRRGDAPCGGGGGPEAGDAAERVRLTKEVVTEEQPVSGEVRKEHVAVDDSDVDPSSADQREATGRSERDRMRSTSPDERVGRRWTIP